MANGSAASDLANRLDILVHLGATGDLSDASLLGRFLGSTDVVSKAALAALVERHGPMVLGTCRQVLDNSEDAHDAFQATFLILARKAGSVRNADSLAGWLHGVARRVAIRARTNEARRKAHEKQVALGRPKESDNRPTGLEGWAELHEEVAQLPIRYREPVVLCYLEGLSTEVAASRIGCPRGTVLSRLARAKERLRYRLTRRGIVPPAVLLASALATSPAQALPFSLIRETVRSAVEFASRRVVVATSAAKLARGVLFAMTLSKLKLCAVIAGVGLLGLGATNTFGRFAEPRDQPKPKVIARPTVEAQIQVPIESPEALKRRRDETLKRLKVEVKKVGGFLSDDGSSVILERTTATDDDLGRIAPLIRDLPQVNRLHLSHTFITDAGLVHVRDLSGLTWLYLENTNVSDLGLVHLKGLTNLVGLPLQNTEVGDKGMGHLAALTKLAWMSLGNTGVGDEGLKHLAGMVRMDVLYLENTPITDVGLVSLQNMKELRDLHLDNTRITDRGLASLKGLTKLERLNLCDTDVTDAGLVNLEPLKALYYLQLHNTLDSQINVIRNSVKVTDAGLVHLQGMKHLDQYGSLFLFNTSVTPAGVARLQQARPELKSIGVGEQRLLGFSQTYREPRGSKPRGS